MIFLGVESGTLIMWGYVLIAFLAAWFSAVYGNWDD
jgi:hypothetical protein